MTEEAFKDGQKYENLKDRVDSILSAIEQSKNRSETIKDYEVAAKDIFGSLMALANRYSYLRSGDGRYECGSYMRKIGACLSEENYLSFKDYEQAEAKRLRELPIFP